MNGSWQQRNILFVMGKVKLYIYKSDLYLACNSSLNNSIVYLLSSVWSYPDIRPSVSRFNPLCRLRILFLSWFKPNPQSLSFFVVPIPWHLQFFYHYPQIRLPTAVTIQLCLLNVYCYFNRHTNTEEGKRCGWMDG